MQFHTPPENQGQIVLVSYGWSDGTLYRRTLDQSDRSVVIRSTDPWYWVENNKQVAQLENWDPWNNAPPVWVEMALDEGTLVYEGHISGEPTIDDA